MRKLAKLIIKARWFFLALFVVMAIASVFLMQKIKTNYDLKKYLPKDSDTIIALQKMQDDGFVYGSTLYVMTQNESVANTENLSHLLMQELNKQERKVSAVTYTFKYDQEGNKTHGLIQIAVIGDEYDIETSNIVVQIKDLLNGEDYVLSGGLIHTSVVKEAIQQQIPIIVIVCVCIVLAVLLCTCKSWIEPFLFFAVIFVGILINMGSNIIFKEISYITQSVATILQMALTMDYAIILLSFFKGQIEEGKPPQEAMEIAIKNGFSAITSSALTTIAGLLALLFMTFTIGQDIGLVLAKGIVISILTVFLFMPPLIIVSAKLLKKQHKAVPMPVKFVAKTGWKTRKFLPLIMVAIIAVAAVLNFTSINYNYTISTPSGDNSQQVRDVFGLNNHVITLIKNQPTSQQTYALAEDYLDFVQNYEGFLDQDGKNVKLNEIYSMVTPYSVDELVRMTGIDQQLVNYLFVFMEKEGQAATPQEIVEFAEANVSDGIMAMTVTPIKLSKITNKSPTSIQLLYNSLGYNRKYQNNVPLGVLVDDLYERRDTLGAFLGADTEATVQLLTKVYQNKEEIASINVLEKLGTATKMFCGKNYNMIIFTMDMPQAKQPTFDLFAELKDKLSSGEFADVETYITGESAVAYDIYESFDYDRLKTGLITIFAILLIIAIMYKSLSLPFVLVLIIQGAIWLSMAFNAITATPVFFMSYIIVNCILMGATVDYGILMSGSYIKNRKSMSKENSLTQSLKLSLPTVFTSGLIMIVCGFCVGLISTVEAINTVGILLGSGAIASVLMIVFVLPGTLILLDKLLLKTTFLGKRKSANDTDDLSDTAKSNDLILESNTNLPTEEK